MNTLNKTNIGIYIISLVLIYLSYTLLLIGISDIINIRSEKTIIQWETNQKKISYQNGIMNVKDLEKSIQYSPRNSFSQLLLARVYIQLAKIKNQNKDKHLKTAEKIIIDAISKMPTAFETWAYMSIIKSESFKNQIEFNIAINNAVKLAPYEDKNQKILIPVIIKKWGALTKNNKELSKKLLSHALQYTGNAGLVIESAKKNNRLSEIKKLTTKKWQINRIELYMYEKN